MAHSDETRRAVRAGYVFDQLALETAADAQAVPVATARRLMPETDQLGVAMGVVQLLLDFVRKNYPQHGAAIAEVLEPFGEEVTKAYG